MKVEVYIKKENESFGCFKAVFILIILSCIVSWVFGSGEASSSKTAANSEQGITEEHREYVNQNTGGGDIEVSKREYTTAQQ